MTDKYQNVINGETLTITIPSGPAAGTYTKEYPTIENGLIFIGHFEMRGKITPLKIKADEHPSIVAHIQARTFMPKSEAELAEMKIERKMRESGFEAAGNASGLWNRLNPVRGEDF